jgi:hypothetical protein
MRYLLSPKTFPTPCYGWIRNILPQHHVENWTDVRGDSLLGQLAKDVESQDQLRSKFFVYRKDDLISVRNQITEFWG